MVRVMENAKILDWEISMSLFDPVHRDTTQAPLITPVQNLMFLATKGRDVGLFFVQGNRRELATTRILD
jgi:hypothetical protein